MKKYIIYALIIAACIGAYFYISKSFKSYIINRSPVVACTAEAKLCPDGSYVGRTGPQCEFTECPAQATSTTSTISIGGNLNINGTNIGVLELVEDSRCPVDVQCIQAGTVRVRVAIDSYNKDFTFTLLVPQVVGDKTITLTSVIPAQKNSKVTVKPSDYQFAFTVVPVVTSIPTSTGIRGTVLLGPTCPVMKNPPDPKCADKPYATTIQIYKKGSSAIIATTKSTSDGKFEISLPTGSYTLVAQGGATLPRCSPLDTVIGKTDYVTVNISCDTGIR